MIKEINKFLKYLKFKSIKYEKIKSKSIKFSIKLIR